MSARSVDDLIARRKGQPIRVDETGEWMFEYDLEVTDGTTSCVQTRQVHYVDGDGIRLRMDLARQYRLDGVALWALGFDDDAVWDAILPTVAEPRPPTTDANTGPSPVDLARMAAAPATNDPARATWSSRPGSRCRRPRRPA